MNGMSRINVQGSSKALLENVFKCDKCNQPLIMFGCSDKRCPNYNIHLKKHDALNVKEKRE